MFFSLKCLIVFFVFYNVGLQGSICVTFVIALRHELFLDLRCVFSCNGCFIDMQIEMMIVYVWLFNQQSASTHLAPKWLASLGACSSSMHGEKLTMKM